MSGPNIHWIGAFIAQFNEEHGIRGVKIGDTYLDNDQLRELQPLEEYPADAFVRDHLGKSFKRPKGWTHYKVAGVCDNPAMGFGPRRLVVVERYDTKRKEWPGQTTMSVTDLAEMEEVTE